MEKNYKSKPSSAGRPFSGRHGLSKVVEKPKDFKGTLKRLAKYLKPHKARLVLVTLMAILGTLSNIISPKILGKATTKLFEGTMAKLDGVPGASVDFQYIYRILIILMVIYAFSALFNYVMQFIMASVSQLTVYELRKEVSDKFSRLPLKYYDSKSNGEILSRATNDIDNIANTLQQSLTQLITAVITIVGVVIMMLSISPVMTLIAVVTLPVSMFVVKTIAKKSQVYFKEQQVILGELNGHIEEVYSGHKIIKAYGKEQDSVEKFDEINERLYNVGWKAQFVSGIIMPLMSLINNFGYVGISVVGGLLVAGERLAIGDIQAFIQYSKSFGHPIVQTANIANLIQSTIASAERVFEVLDEEEEINEVKISKGINHVSGIVKIENLDFSYNKETPLIKDMNIEVCSGQKVAIVGPTGAGKTTLVNLLMRFYEIDNGSIIVDGVDIKKLSKDDLRSMFGMVLQDTWVFNGTIRDNILYGKEGATEEELLKATTMAHADRFIRTLPEGYDTILEEDANNISSGQKQLLTIARAFLADAPILILDEATSNVDTRTERIIQTAMERLMSGRTSFVIAHRLSTIKDADLILVMNDGKIIEKGNHKELIEKNGFYADLYNSQFAS